WCKSCNSGLELHEWAKSKARPGEEQRRPRLPTYPTQQNGILGQKPAKECRRPQDTAKKLLLSRSTPTQQWWVASIRPQGTGKGQLVKPASLGQSRRQRRMCQSRTGVVRYLFG